MVDMTSISSTVSEDNMKDKEDFFENLHNYQAAYEEAMKKYDKNSEEWWDSLSYEDKLKAFYEVTRRIHKADVIDGGSYRYALYEVFGFDEAAYALGMRCGYLDIHNLIFDGKDYVELEKKGLIPNDKVSNKPDASDT